MKYDYYIQNAKYTTYKTVKHCIKYSRKLSGNRLQTFWLFRMFNQAHKSQFNIRYAHHGHRRELVFVEACCQSRLPGFEGASMVRVTLDHEFSIPFISGDTAGHSMCAIPSWRCHRGTQNCTQISDKQMAITVPPGSVGTDTDPGFHRRCKGHICHHGGKHPIW